MGKQILNQKEMERSNDQSPDTPNALVPFMPMHASNAEIHLFSKYITQSRSYLEFGCGGSTFLTLYISQAQILSIESDPSFIAQLSSYPLIQQDQTSQNPRLRFYPIDIGRVGKWGFPIDENYKESFPLYSQKIFTELSSEQIAHIDTIFIDGRFRVACVLSVLLHCSESVMILIHDFFNREHYHIILEFLTCIERIDTLGVFHPKPNNDTSRILALLQEYQYNAN